MKHFLLICAALLLAACTTPSINTGPVTVTPTPGPSDAVTEVEVQQMKNAPSVQIDGRSVEAIFADVEKYRVGRGMNVVSKSRKHIEFSAVVARAKVPTQARVRYLLVKSGSGFKLSARAYQISNPGAAKEKTADITSAVATKLQQELEKYRKSGWN
ncbi:hypothetical protein ACTSKR_15685 [Chitinibacteraceae bacterium HSL-7]